MLQDIKTAVRCYLQCAFPGEPPEKTKHQLHTLSMMTSDDEFWSWDFLEVEGDRTSMRFGNNWYPHMKLILRGRDSADLLFYVDAHDQHFSLPPQFEDRLTRIREKNQDIKQRIEDLLQKNHLSIMSASKGLDANYEPLPFPVTVLAIDDEPHILNLIQIFITKLGAAATTFISVDEAMAYLEKQGPADIIFCDIMMPEKSGYFFHDWLRENNIDVPFYFVTGLDKDNVRIHDAAIIQKPFKVCDIFSVIQNYVQAKSKQKPN